ncbi:oligomeric golgi complex component, COG2-domain-containing protein [Lipomyces japonicus]|uniref:oligomeric golgi complex component, COG2-domain-containing protein n=1 Tax=Lipomyces japonicus TaxID=56871 RepID=UPI0034CE6DE2
MPSAATDSVDYFTRDVGPTRTRQINDDYFAYEEEQDNSADNELDDNGLPYAKPIRREAFSSPQEFDPDDFLLTQHRFQTLEDLERQLVDWSHTLQKELVELINQDYADFVGLGRSVAGGEIKVTDIKLNVISFRREVEGISIRMTDVVQEIDELLLKKKQIRQKENLGRSLLFYAQRIQQLEFLLDNEDPIQFNTNPTSSRYSRITSLVSDYVNLTDFRKHIHANHPFVKAQEARVAKIKDRLLSELESLLQLSSQERSSEGSNGIKSSKKISPIALDILILYRNMGEEAEGAKALRKI